jgi:basic amino acid/polyamine antiporter, APA family
MQTIRCLGGCMSEELTFQRKASGLVRGLSFYDAFGVGLNTVQPIWSIWYTIMLGLGLFLGANLIITILIAGAMCGIFGPLVWGILGGSMPRSGGEYIYNSRIIHPVVALAASFAQVVAVTYWSFIMSIWLCVPSLAMLAQFMGWKGLSDFTANKYGQFTVAIIANLLVFVTVVFGMRVYKAVQKPIIVIAIAGPIIVALGLTLSSKATFIHNWNLLALQYHSVDYHHFVTAVGTAAGSPVPLHWNWPDTFGALAGAFTLFLYTYAVAYVAGEVKRPTKTILAANWMSLWIPMVLGLWVVIALYHVVGFRFLSASAYNDLNGGVPGYHLPYSSYYFTLSWIASGKSWIVAVAASLAFLTTSFIGMAINLLVITRASFAWGLDRMGPKWFTDINSRWASPVKLYAMFTGIIIVGTACYQLFFTTALSGLTAAGMQMVSVFLITGVSAILFPYRKRCRTIWETSPYRGWKIAGVPLVTIAGIVYVAFVAILLYFSFVDSKTRDITGRNLFVFAAAYAFGIAWYFFWKQRSATVGIDVSLTYGTLPPE